MENPEALVKMDYWRTITPTKIQELINNGSDVNAENDSGTTPLHLVARYNEDPEVIRFLVRAGANVNARDYQGNTPVFLALYNTNPEIITTLVQVGANLDMRNDLGATPLLVAVLNIKNIKILTALIKAGANVHAQHQGMTCIHSAVVATQILVEPEIIIELIRAGVDVNKVDTNEMIPLHYAVMSDDDGKITRILLQAGSNVSAKGSIGATPLHASVSSNPEKVTALIRAGAVVNTQDDYGDTPLHYAVQRCKNPRIISILLNAGADANAQNESGYTPLHHAAKFTDNSDVIMLLLKAGANPKARVGLWKTPFSIAKKNPHLKYTEAYWALHIVRFQV